MGAQKHQDTGDWLVTGAKDYIEAHCLEKFSLKKISDALYINGSYLLRRFKSRTGQTLLEYHNTVRCERARDLLENTAMSVSEVGAAVGFVSSAHFSHVFRKITHCTPTTYREGCRNVMAAGKDGQHAGQ